MQTHQLSNLSWVATPGSLDALPPSLVKGLHVRPSRLDPVSLLAACNRNAAPRYFASANGWIYAFGFQVGLGAVAREVSKARGLALSFENNAKRDIRLCSVYRDGQLVRQISDIDGHFSEEGQPLPGEPQLTGALQDAAVEQLSRAWGADITRLEWETEAVRAAPRVPRALWVGVGVMLLVLVAVLGVRAVPSTAQRCRKACERSWRSTYEHTPECQGVALDECEALRTAIKECSATCR